MAKNLKVGVETDIRRMRLAHGVSIQEMCAELLMPAGLYSAHECGNRSYSGERLKIFKEDAVAAIHKIVAKRKEAMYDLKLNIREDDDEADLIWQCLTDDLYKEALRLLAKGKNLIQVCTTLEIDEKDLSSRLRADNITNFKDVDVEVYESLFPNELDIFGQQA